MTEMMVNIHVAHNKHKPVLQEQRLSLLWLESWGAKVIIDLHIHFCIISTPNSIEWF